MEARTVRYGIIGTGQIGSMLVDAIIGAGHEGPLYVHNRTREKAESLRRRYPERVVVCEEGGAAARQSDLLFLCVKSGDAPAALREIRSDSHSGQILLSTNSNLTLADLEDQSPCMAGKLIPSITQYTRTGVSLIVFGSRMGEKDRDNLTAFLSTLGTPVPIAEDQVRLYSDLTSCGPAFVADWLRKMAAAAVERGMPAKDAEFLLTEMVRGVGNLLAQTDWGFEGIVKRIALPGGVTAAGLEVLAAADRDLFARLFDATQARQDVLNRLGH